MIPPNIDKAYVDSLAAPRVRHASEPPHDITTVLAIAVQAALYEAWELVELGKTHLRLHGGKPGEGAEQAGRDAGLHAAHGQVYAGTRIIRRVAEVLDLLHPGELCTPGERLLASRNRAGLTQPELAEAADVHRSHLSRIERDDRTLTPLLAAAFAKVLDVSPEYLLTGREVTS